MSPWSQEKPMESFRASEEVVKVRFDSWTTTKGGTAGSWGYCLSGMNSEYCSIVTQEQSDGFHRQARYLFCFTPLLTFFFFCPSFLTSANGLILFWKYFVLHTLQFHLCILSLFILSQIPLLLFSSSSSNALTMLQYSENASAFPCAHKY